VYFDVSDIAGFGNWTAKADQIVERIRQIGVQRIVFGSDEARGGGLSPHEAWAYFLKLPLTDSEKRTVANNVAPYMN